MRDCKNCAHNKADGCEIWECKFKPNTYEQGYKDGYVQALKDALAKLRKTKEQ